MDKILFTAKIKIFCLKKQENILSRQKKRPLLLQSFGCRKFTGLFIVFIFMYHTRKVQHALSKTLIKWRIEKRLSQEQLSAISGLSRQYLSRLEACKQLPRLDSLLQILVPLEKTFADLGAFLDSFLQDSNTKDSERMVADKGPFWDEK